MDGQKRKRFFWGVCLAWLPWIPAIFGLAQAFRGISAEKATGVAVLTGALSESFILIGLVSAVAFEIGAIGMLVSALDRERWFRSLFSVVSICLGVVMLVFVAFFVWYMGSVRRAS